MSIYDLWFSRLKINLKDKIRLLKTHDSIENIWISVFKKNEFNFNKKIYEKFLNAWKLEELKKMYYYMKQNNINCINYYDSLYPQKLKNHDDAPGVLFFKGKFNLINNGLTVGIVGSRDCSLYGKNVAINIANDLARNNINVISGMARGIDSMAHKGALKENGRTFAVLGCGVDVVYPKENSDIYKQIQESGCVISEFEPKTKPFSWNFPLRNRIISGLSDLLIVVEAGEKSGSLITVNYALQQGVDVMAVPGSISSKFSKGTNELIKDGAYIFTELQDIYSILGIKYEKSLNKKQNIEKKYNKIYSVLSDVPMHIDKIVEITNIDIKYLYELLFEMQVKKHVNCIDGSFYVKNQQLI